MFFLRCRVDRGEGGDVTEYNIGQEVWVVPNRNGIGKPHAECIIRLGRKWIGLDNCRFDKGTGHIDGCGYSSPGRVYRTRDEWAVEQQRQKVWAIFQSEIRGTYTVPPNVTEHDIRRAAEALGIVLDKVAT